MRGVGVESTVAADSCSLCSGQWAKQVGDLLSLGCLLPSHKKGSSSYFFLGVRYSQADQWEALLGLHVQSQTNEWTVRRSIKRIIAHQDYNPLTYDNDIALMELSQEVVLNQNIWPICLPSSTHDFPAGQEAWITGWGATREGGENGKGFICFEMSVN